MNFYGINDLRITHLGKALSLCDYNIIIPEIPEIKNILINENTLTSLEFFYDLFFQIYPNRIKLFLISFSGGLSLIPICNKKYKNKINSIITIGAYSNFATTIDYVLKNYNYDNYGTYILLYNYIDIILKNNKIKNYFLDRVVFNSMTIDNNNYLQLKNGLSKKEILFCDKIEKSLNFRLDIAEEIINNKRHLIKKLSPIHYIKDLTVKNTINFIHGKEDKVISKNESIDLHNKIKFFKKSNLLVTDLISHGDSSFSLSSLQQIPKIISSFNDFFTTNLI